MMTFESLTEEFILIAVEPKAIIPFISRRIATIFYHHHHAHGDDREGLNPYFLSDDNHDDHFEDNEDDKYDDNSSHFMEGIYSFAKSSIVLDRFDQLV